MTLASRVRALEKVVDQLAPSVITDEDIADAMAGLHDGAPAMPYEIEALYGLIEPALMAAVVKGAQALRVCQSGNIVRPEPVGEVDLFARLLSYDHNTLAPPDLARRALPMTPRFPAYGDPPMRATPTCTSVAEVRETLMFLMYRQYGGYRLRSASMNPPDSLVPTLTDAERSGLLSLVEPLQQDPDRDLPLLLWNDTGGSLQTSWPSRSGQMWTRVDRQNERPGYLLLSPPGVIDGTCLKEDTASG